MVIYRSIGYEHSCPPGGCAMCKEAYQPAPEHPRDYGLCCQYWEGGQPVTVVICDVPAPLTKPGRTRPGARRGKTRKMVIQPKAGAKTRAVAPKRTAPAKKTARRAKTGK